MYSLNGLVGVAFIIKLAGKIRQFVNVIRLSGSAIRKPLNAIKLSADRIKKFLKILCFLVVSFCLLSSFFGKI